MPVVDGIEACKRIRLLEERRKVQCKLPSKFTVHVLRNTDSGADHTLNSRCAQRGLSGIYKEALPQRWHGHVPE
jgi:CheY-like chemotaxis protein